MIVTKLGVLLGGIGLFLLGMHLMTDGLKTAAGTALRSVLEKGTQTPMRGILSGALITAIVQSSSAVTVAIIGFVNAGLMTLRQAIGVIYGRSASKLKRARDISPRSPVTALLKALKNGERHLLNRKLRKKHRSKTQHKEQPAHIRNGRQ
ncbi:MAG: Na/Pi symporter [Deltaproteobacteria bacterium]|nr:Na/Pi symporter [Deltaproteobacteria bacterium]